MAEIYGSAIGDLKKERKGRKKEGREERREGKRRVVKEGGRKGGWENKHTEVVFPLRNVLKLFRVKVNLSSSSLLCMPCCCQ